MLAPSANDSITAPATTFGSTATYSCNTGYSLTGAATRTCQADGTWSGTVPTCSPQMLTVTIKMTGFGTGTVTSAPAGVACGSTCRASYAYGTAVSLAATPDANQYFAGWDSAVCTGSGACVFTITSNTAVAAAFFPVANIVFTTSTTQTPALGGLSGADALCAQRAAAAKLPGTYKAWLSTSTVNAIDRLGSASGWVRTDGKPVSNSVADIAHGKLFYPPRLDEFGKDLGADPVVMTGTWVDGTLTSYPGYTTCGDFTSAVNDPNSELIGGSASASSEMFTDYFAMYCDQDARIYCFSIDRQVQLAPTPVTGRHAFVTAGNWIPGGGITSADTLCRQEASDANLPGTYKALLAPTGASAASRFNTNGLPWIRADGIPLMPTAAAFFSATLFDVPPNVTADGFVYYGNDGVWGGAATMTTPGKDETNCVNWTSNSASASAGAGPSGDSAAQVYFDAWPSVPDGIACNATWMYLTCLQE